MRTTSRTLFALAGVLLFAACTDNSLAPVNGDASGSYDLSAINDAPPPVVISAPGASTTETLTGGNFTLNTDGSFSETLTFDDTTSGQTTSNSITCNGTFSQSGQNFTFSEVANADQTCGGTYGGAWDGGSNFQFIFNGGAFVLLYSKAVTP
ncbi:MAG: hypothetical protein ACREMS_14310 [Gemmatimonadaceae bacterium]